MVLPSDRGDGRLVPEPVGAGGRERASRAGAVGMCARRPHVAEVRGETGLTCARPLRSPFQVESVFETLVEHGPEEESTLTSKMRV